MKKKPASKIPRGHDPHRSTPLTPQEVALLDKALQVPPVDYSAETVHSEEVRDLKLKLQIAQDESRSFERQLDLQREIKRQLRTKIAKYETSIWPLPKFNYGDRVKLQPLASVKARVTGLHMVGHSKTVEYDVRYFHAGKQQRCRVFEDELKADK